MSTPDPSPAPQSKPMLEAETNSTDPPNKTVLTPVQNLLARFPQHRTKGLFWLVVLATSTLTGAIAFQWLSGLPPVPNCGKLFKATLSDSGQLYCADQAARKGDEASLVAALGLANSIKPDNALFEQSRQLANHWSESILVIARQRVEAGDLKKGVALAQKVPKTSAVYANAQAMIQDWQGNWQKGEAIYQKAREAIQAQNWGQATELVRDLVQLGSNYWQRRADKVTAEMSIEQEAFYKINSAQELVNSGNPDNIAKAIQTVSQINPKRLARKRVGEKIEEWSQKLVDVAKNAQADGNYAAMVDAAQKVPPTVKVAAVASSYLQLGRAGVAAKDSGLWSAIQAYTLSAQIDYKTPVYELSKNQRQKWEGQVQSWGQLAVAQWFASLDQVTGYQVAVEQAAMVGADQTRRVEAQTLIASWTKQISSFQDRQFIARAKQIAVDNTVISFQTAILEASKILSGPLREAAQTLIAQWNDATQRIQDQPILDQAIALAKKGELNSAIQTAEKISSNRALHREAQAKIDEWVAQLQSAEDRPILNEAEALAGEGRLSEAIARASDIGSRRAIYSEAQGRIAEWAERRRQSQPRGQSQSSEPAGAPIRESRQNREAPQEPAPAERTRPAQEAPPEPRPLPPVENSAPPAEERRQNSEPRPYEAPPAAAPVDPAQKYYRQRP